MSLKMTTPEREKFLADVHIGVISIERHEAPPLAVPIWYDFRPGVGVWVITVRTSEKGRALEAANRFSLVAQVETPPSYAYVSVEGPVVSVVEADREKHTRPMAHRYFGESLGDLYVDSQADEGNMVFTMQPERWRTVDYGKVGGQG